MVLKTLKEFKLRRDTNHMYRDILRAETSNAYHSMVKIKEVYQKLYGKELIGLESAMALVSEVHWHNQEAMKPKTKGETTES